MEFRHFFLRREPTENCDLVRQIDPDGTSDINSFPEVAGSTSGLSR